MSNESLIQLKILEEVINKIESHLKWLKTVENPNKDLIDGIAGIQKALEEHIESYRRMIKGN